MCKGLLSAKKQHTLGASTWVLVRYLEIVRYRLLETEENLERKPSVNKSTDAGCSNLVGKQWAWLEPESVLESEQKEESRVLDELAWWPQSAPGTLFFRWPQALFRQSCSSLSLSESLLRLSGCLLKHGIFFLWYHTTGFSLIHSLYCQALSNHLLGIPSQSQRSLCIKTAAFPT